MIGGGGEKKTLRLVAKYADACNVAGNAEEIRHKFDVLKKHCDDVGRDYDEISKTAPGVPDPRHRRAAARRASRGTPSTRRSSGSARLGAAGIDHVILSTANTTDPAAYEKAAEVDTASSRRRSGRTARARGARRPSGGEGLPGVRPDDTVGREATAGLERPGLGRGGRAEDPVGAVSE